MKISDYIIGFGLIILGVIFLFDNFGYIEFDFHVMWSLWPLILIGFGIYLIYKHSKKNPKK